MDGKLGFACAIVVGTFVGWAGMCWWLQEPAPKNKRTGVKVFPTPDKVVGDGAYMKITDAGTEIGIDPVAAAAEKKNKNERTVNQVTFGVAGDGACLVLEGKAGEDYLNRAIEDMKRRGVYS
jgi:hypothetical protein